MSTTPGPKPAIRVEPHTVLATLGSLERDAQIDALEKVHSELVTRLNRTQV